MLDFLQELDGKILFWIHQNLHSEAGNMIIPWFRDAKFWSPLYLVMIGLFIYWWKTKFWLPMLFLLVGVGLADLSSVELFKKPIGRQRPCHTFKDPDQLELLVNCGGQFGFVSSHATNHMAMAVFFFCLFKYTSPKWRYLWIAWALLIGFSQIYVGVHYPFDVVGGFILGGLIGFLAYRLLIRFYPGFSSKPSIT